VIPQVPPAVIAHAHRRLHEGCQHVAYGRERNPHPAEAIVDVDSTSLALDTAKEDVAEAIRDEVQRVVGIARRTRVPHVRLQLTQDMVDPLVALYQWGRDEARREIARGGWTPVALASPPANLDEVPDDIRPVVLALSASLERLEVGVGRDLRDVLQATPGTPAGMAARRLLDVPGALDAASYLVTPSYVAGVDDVYRANEDLFGGWLYSAVLDGGTCGECRSKDGTVYDTLEELYEDLPDFGPNPLCAGGSRCRCRGVPLP
jgi:hypothetical protein